MTNAAEPRPEPSGRRITLSGLIMIIGVISILTAIFLTALTASKESANKAMCEGHLMSLYKAMHVYIVAFGNNKDYMPHTGDAFFTCLIGHSGPEHPSSYPSKAPMRGIEWDYICPSSGSNETSVTPGGAMADYLGPSRHPLVPAGNPSALTNGIPPKTPIGCDKPGNHPHGGIILQFNGDVYYRDDPDFSAAVKACSD